MNTTYGRLCEATADVLFGPDRAGSPVYTLPDDDALSRIVELVGLAPSDARAQFCRVVRSTLYLDVPNRSPLHWHADATQRHLTSKAPLQTPPSLPLLVVLTLAAEAMHADTSMAANNFYGRLIPLLGVPREREALFAAAYRRHGALLWRSLNAWLEAWEGERGVPTAYSLGGMRYIGLPMSQAVVRQHDRLGLVEVFEEEGLPPGFRMSPEDMEVALNNYATSQPSPLSSNIRRLWSNQDARARIVQAACLELESWTGAQRQSKISSSPSAKLVAYLRTLLRAVLDLNLAIPTDGKTNEVVFESRQGEIVVPAVESSPGRVRLASTDTVSPASLVGDILNGRLGDNSSSRFTRRPRRVVPLRWNELDGCYIEVERVSLGEDNLILAVADAENKVKQLLDTCARPGWSVLSDIPGLPTEWVVFRRVEIVTAPMQTPHVDLIPLVPRSTSSLTICGGFDLPGRLRKWSSLQPPEVIAYSAGANAVKVRIFGGDHASGEEERLSCEAAGELAVLTLANYDLADGEYIASMFVDSENSPRSSSLVRLRSADTPLYRVEDADIRLVYSPESGPLWPLSAGPADWINYVNGARVLGNVRRSLVSTPMSEYVPKERRPDIDVAPARIPLGDPVPSGSCMVTGAHRFELPPALGERPRSKTIEGECTTCGLVKRFAATPWAANRRRSRMERVRRVVELPPVAGSEELDQRILFDSLCYVGQGSYRDLERIAGNVEGSGLYADKLLRTQEVLGHIDVRRDDYLRVSDWAINAPTIIPIETGSWTLIGSLSRHMLRALRELFNESRVIEQRHPGAFQVTLEIGSELMMSRLEELSLLGIEIRETSPALEIAQSLPALSHIERGLKRIPIPSYRTIEKWDTHSASWIQSDSLASVGAYRLKEFQTLYVARSPHDIESGTAAVGTAQLVKHIANRWSGDPLVGYHGRTRSVVAPLGADLPALYGRALALCSGRAPLEHPKSHLVQYSTVPHDVADVIFDRLTK